MAANSKDNKASPDFATVGGLVVALAGILGGLILEGGEVVDVRQATAALIVLGGTLGAVMVTTPADVLLSAAKSIRFIFWQTPYAPEQTIEKILEYAAQARRTGIVSLEPDIEKIPNPFLRKALSLGIDGTDLQELRKMMELELETEERLGKADARVFESAGGYAPTIGIIGAVLGLIQVMKHLEDIRMVGHGIAVAFVATVYGLAVANLFFLPAAAKLKARVETSIRMKELMLEGVCGIIQGLHPTMIASKLGAYHMGRTGNSRNLESRKGGRPRAA